MNLLTSIEDTCIDEGSEIEERLKNFFCIEIFEEFKNQFSCKTFKCRTTTYVIYELGWCINIQLSKN